MTARQAIVAFFSSIKDVIFTKESLIAFVNEKTRKTVPQRTIERALRELKKQNKINYAVKRGKEFAILPIEIVSEPDPCEVNYEE